MQILLDPGTYRCGNMGDVAMLQAAVMRLREFWPTAAVHVLTNDDVALHSYCRVATAVPVAGRQEWFAEHPILGRRGRQLPPRTRACLSGIQRSLRRTLPFAMQMVLALRLRSRGQGASSVSAFLTCLRNADLVVICGQGTLNDLHVSHARQVLELVEMATAIGIPTAMMGQGIGPLTDRVLRDLAMRVFPRIDLIAVREKRASLPLLAALGVAPGRIAVTGDDAIEMAYTARPKSLGAGIGINLRVAAYAGVAADLVPALRMALHSFAGSHSAPLVPVPIMRSGENADTDTIRQLLAGYDDRSTGGIECDTPLRVVQALHECRIVVTGAYHAAVFALSQGIPAVCLTKSSYYDTKFNGLADQFGQGCQVVSLDSPDFHNVLLAAMHHSWMIADDVRADLLRAAASQVSAARDAYGKLARLVNARVRAQLAVRRARRHRQRQSADLNVRNEWRPVR